MLLRARSKASIYSSLKQCLLLDRTERSHWLAYNGNPRLDLLGKEGKAREEGRYREIDHGRMNGAWTTETGAIRGRKKGNKEERKWKSPCLFFLP